VEEDAWVDVSSPAQQAAQRAGPAAVALTAGAAAAAAVTAAVSSRPAGAEVSPTSLAHTALPLQDAAAAT
jgi:hypothetical protein